MAPTARQNLALAMLLGKPLRPAAVLTEVHDRLQALSASVVVHLIRADAPLPAWLSDAGLIVQRSLGILGLRSALALEDAGTRFCNRIAATIAVRDRALTVRKLLESGLQVPRTTPAASWADVRKTADGGAVVVKAADQAIGRGSSVLKIPVGRLPQHLPFSGPYIVQEQVESDGRDYKVYVVGREVRGLIKMSSAMSGAQPAAEPFAVNPTLADLARKTGAALDLEIYGVDFIYGRCGPVIVDVNPFPGFRGVADAPSLVASYLLERCEEVGNPLT